MKAVVERTSVAERMGAQGLIMSSNALASVAAPLAVPPLAAVVGWRWAFVLAAGLGVLVYVAVRLWLPPPSERAEDAAPAASGVPPRQVLRIGVLWRFSLMLFGYSALMWGLSTWIPSYLNSERGLSLTSAGVLVAVPSLAAALGTLLGGRLSDRFEGHHRKVIVPAMSVAAPALCLMALSPSLTGAIACGTIAVFAASLCYMPIFAVPLRSLTPNSSVSAVPSSCSADRSPAWSYRRCWARSRTRCPSKRPSRCWRSARPSRPYWLWSPRRTRSPSTPLSRGAPLSSPPRRSPHDPRTRRSPRRPGPSPT